MTKKQRIAFIAALALVAAAFFYLNCITPFYADDYSYMFTYAENAPKDRITNLYELYLSQLNHYKVMNGRAIVHTLVQIFLIPQSRALFNVCNTLVFMALGFAVYFAAYGTFRRFRPLSLFAVYALVWLTLPGFGQSCLWLTGSVNYMWTAFAALCFLLPYRSDSDGASRKWLRVIGMPFLGLPAGWSGENACIAAAVGLKNTTTGDTLCDEKHPIILESMEFPEPVIRVAIEPKTKAGQEKMGIALMKLAEEDPTFKTYTDEETGQTIIAGMGELHLEIIVDRLLREFKVEANVGAPQVAYKETIKKSVQQDTKYARQSGGKGQYGHVKIRVEPNESGKGYEFVNEVVGGAVPKEYIPAVDAGIQGAMLSGVLAGYPVVDVKVTLYDGSYHEVDSSEMAFKIAGSMAFKEACQKADPTLLEPIMKVCVIVPEEYMGDVIGDLNSRRGQIQGFEARSGAQQIDAFVPLSEMFGYATDLRSRTQGRGQYTMEPSHYIEIPKNIRDKIIDQRMGARAMK